MLSEKALARAHRAHVKKRTKKALTTGELAKLLDVAPRTVSKWCDNGHLRSYRLPYSDDRRIPRTSVIEFLKDHDVPIPKGLFLHSTPAAYIRSSVNLIFEGLDGVLRVENVLCQFALAKAVYDDPPIVVVLDRSAVNRDEIAATCLFLRNTSLPPLIACLCVEDDDEQWVKTQDFDLVSTAPHDFTALSAYLVRYVQSLIIEG